MDVNDVAEDQGYDNGDIPAYDTCGIRTADFDTHWTSVLAINSILWFLHAICTGLLCMAFLAWPIGCVGVTGHMLGWLFHLGAIIITGIFRYSDEGEECAKQTTKVYYNVEQTGDSFTYEEHGDAIEGLFISAVVLFCFLNCFVSCMNRVARMMIRAQMKK